MQSFSDYMTERVYPEIYLRERPFSPLSFSDYVEREDRVVMYGINKRGNTPGKAMAKSQIKSVKPAKAVSPFAGMLVPGEIFGKPKRKPSGIVGQ